VAEHKNMPLSYAKWLSPDFLEATGIFLMQTELIETVRENMRGVSISAPSRPFG